MLFRLFSCACVVIGLGWGGLATSNPPLAPPPTQWVLSTLGGKSLPAAQLSARPLLVLPAIYSAQPTPCQGDFSPPVIARVLHLPRVISTMMRASDAAVETELRYLNMLEQTTHFEVKGDSLYLYAAKQSTPLATFKSGKILY